MPADDLVINVRQVAGYPPLAIAPPASQLLLQIAGLGSSYASISPAALVATALAGGGDMVIGGKLSLQSLIGGSAQFSNGSFNLLWARKANVGQFNATCGTINCVPIATVNDLNALLTGVVSSFNLRSGPVTLTLADITGAGGAPIESHAFSGAPSAPTPAAGTSDGQLATTAFVMNAVTGGTSGVASFNTRTGVVTLQAADITGVGGALLASPTFTGAPLAPTAAPGTNSTQLATTAFVAAAIAAAGATGVVTFNGRAGAVTLIANDISGAGGAILASPAFTGSPTAPTPPVADNSLRLASTAFVTTAIAAAGAGYAPLASPAFTGDPTAPTPAPGVNTTQLATTAFVTAAVAAAIVTGVTTFNGRAGAVSLIANDISGAGGALLASPALTGVPTAPTATAGTTTLQIATTAFVMAALASIGAGVSSFNTRVGAVTLIAGDITGAGGALQSSLANYLLLTGGVLTGALTPSQTAGIVGTTAANNANAGAVGEVIASNVLTASAVNINTGAATNVTSIALTAGDWDVSGEVYIAVGSGATVCSVALNTVSAAMPVDSSLATSRHQVVLTPAGTFTNTNTQIFPLSVCRASLAAGATYYLIALCTYTGGQAVAWGSIMARRVR